MKKFIISATLLGALMLTSCGTTGSALPGPSGTNLTNNGTTEVGTSLLGNVLGSTVYMALSMALNVYVMVAECAFYQAYRDQPL